MAQGVNLSEVSEFEMGVYLNCRIKHRKFGNKGTITGIVLDKAPKIWRVKLDEPYSYAGQMQNFAHYAGNEIILITDEENKLILNDKN